MRIGLTLGRVFGVRVRIDISALFVAGLVAVQLIAPLGVLPAIAVAMGFLASILGHELGHAVVARQYGVATEDIRLWALGGVARLEGPLPSPRAEAATALAGPLVSLAIGVVAVWIGLGTFDPTAAAWRGVFLNLGLLNLVLGVFNLLPGAPLDGGRVVSAARWAMHGDRYRAIREAARLGFVLAFVVGFVGILAPLAAGGLWLLLTAAFLWASARVEMVGADIGEALAGITVGELTWYGVAQAGPDMDADSMLWQRTRLGAAGGVTVVDAEGDPLGVVLEEQMWKIPATERAHVMLDDMVIPFDDTVRARSTEELSSVIGRGRRMLVTVWENDQLVGMIPPKRLREQLAPVLGSRLPDYV